MTSETQNPPMPAPPLPQLKSDLLQQVQSLELEEALLPSQHPAIDQLIHDLEARNPIAQPLREAHWPMLLGTWELVYASQGTVVTRRINSPLPLSIHIQRVWQRLSRAEGGRALIATENGAVLALPVVGELTATAQGTWQPYEEGESANVSFGAVTLQATRLLGLAGLHLPKINLPVLEFLRREALWITSYLDDDLRIGRGATGNLFVFCRQPRSLGTD
ncbi:MAG: PAP fibrillin [Leptolyngbyaceae cyanobacterium SM2_3_12]|nr:PAP fibrillin [Leptolyngbyaceae cyanobacterium SM2_3_12]